MSCLSSCLGSNQPKKYQTNKRGLDEHKLSEKKLQIMKFNENEGSKKFENFPSSPLRERKKVQKYVDNFVLDKAKEEHINNDEMNCSKNYPFLKKMLTKQRFSQMNLEVLKCISENNQQTSHKDKSQSAHWDNKGSFKCYFCGGAKCKHENYLNNKNYAIEGLHSNFITDFIIASQRPSTVIITKFSLIEKFMEMNIGLIVNVQREGEHPYCGPNKKLEDSGFSYNPHIFLTGDVKCKVSGWKDMSVPQSINFMLDIVKEMSVMIKEKKKKVLVHCHAGYGRTGIVIACYMIFHSSKTVKEVVEEIRKKRSGCIQKKDQFLYCEKFANYINKNRIIFNLSANQNLTKKPVEYFLRNQKDITFGSECEKLENVPKLIFIILDRLLITKRRFNIPSESFFRGLCHFQGWNGEHEEVLTFLKVNLISHFRNQLI